MGSITVSGFLQSLTWFFKGLGFEGTGDRSVLPILRRLSRSCGVYCRVLNTS